MTSPRIYVACLSSYNNGILHGAWIECTNDPDEIQDGINQVLKSSPMDDAEEWEIHDYEYFCGFNPRHYSQQELYDIALFIDEHEELGAELLNIHSDIETAKYAFEENYLGCYESLAKYAEELTTDCCEIPAYLEYYIDYEAMARDMELNGEFYSIEIGYQEYHLFMN